MASRKGTSMTKSFNDWMREQKPTRTIRVLTPEAQADRDSFEADVRDYGCTCFIAPPCGFCTHPGNPLNQEDDEFYQEIEE